MIKKIPAILVVALLLIFPAAATAPPEIDAVAAIVIEKSTGEVIFDLNADQPLPVASITKVMTGLLALEYGDPDSVITVAQSALKGLPEMGSAVYLIAGEEVGFMDMLAYILVASGNDGANAMAEHIAGSIDAFVDMMNSKAEALGMTKTQFKNPHGLTAEGHHASARDIAILCMYAMENETFRQVVNQTEVILPITNKHNQTTKKFTTNFLLSVQSQSGYRYPGASGVKTGFTTPAGYCLAASLEKDDLTFFTVVLGANKYEDGRLGNFTETIKLFDYAKDHFSMQTLLKSTEPIVKIPLRLAADKEDVMLQPEHAVTALLPSDFSGMEDERLELIYTAQEDGIDAPVELGQPLGTLTVKYDGRVYATMALVSAETVPRSEVLHVLDRVGSFFSSTLFKVILGVFFGLIGLFVAYVIIINRQRKKKRRKYGGTRYKM